MQHMQQRLTAEFERVVSEAGLELVQVEANHQGARGVSTSWLVMDGLDARLSIQALFASGRVNVTLGGQAASDQPNSWYRERSLIPKAAPEAGMKVTEVGALYTDGDRLRRIFGAVRELLAPYARTQADGGRALLADTPALPGESLASRKAAGEVLTGYGLTEHEAGLVLRRAYGHLSGSFNYTGVPGARLGYVDYDREQGTYAIRTPEDTPAQEAR